MLFVILNKSDAKLQLFFGLWCRMKGKIIKNFCEGRSHHRKVNMPQKKAASLMMHERMYAAAPAIPRPYEGRGRGGVNKKGR